MNDNQDWVGWLGGLAQQSGQAALNAALVGVGGTGDRQTSDVGIQQDTKPNALGSVGLWFANNWQTILSVGAVLGILWVIVRKLRK